MSRIMQVIFLLISMQFYIYYNQHNYYNIKYPDFVAASPGNSGLKDAYFNQSPLLDFTRTFEIIHYTFNIQK